MLIQVYNTSKNEMPANDIDSAHDFMKTIGWREALVHFLKWPRSQWRALAQTLIAECSDCRWHSKSANIYKIPFLIPPFSNTTKQTTSLYSVHLGLLQSIVEVTINTPPPHVHCSVRLVKGPLCWARLQSWKKWPTLACKQIVEKGFEWCEGWSKPGFQSILFARCQRRTWLKRKTAIT